LLLVFLLPQFFENLNVQCTGDGDVCTRGAQR
jgi:hypothetical protein